jgi:hypothetical protein
MAAAAVLADALSDAGNAVPQTTVRKVRKTSKPLDGGDENMTVEEYLIQQFEDVENRVRAHTGEKIQMLQAEFNKMKSALLAGAGLGYQITLEAVEGPYKGATWTHTLKLPAPDGIKGKGKSKTDVVTVHVGRSKATKYTKSGISLAKDDSVSTCHAEIRLVRGKGLLLEDRGSTNGTTVDEVELIASAPVPLVDGQTICFGSETKVVIEIRPVE